MSQAGSERDPGEAAPSEELTKVVAELRAELQSIRERELRRESRLVTFDQQVAQMEASLEIEVGRLRTTGAAVDLITEHLRIAVRELLGERAQMQDDLDDLRARITALSAPDLQPVLEQLDQVSSRLAALPGRELRPMADQLEQLRQQVGSLPRVELGPVTAQLDALLEAVPDVDLNPVLARLSAIEERLGALDDGNDLARVLDQIAVLRDQVTALPTPDLGPVVARVEALREQIGSIPAPDLDPVLTRIAALLDQVAAAPSPDLTPIERRLDLLGEVDLEPLEARITALHEQVSARPVTDLGPVLQELADVRTAVADGLASLPPPPDDTEVRADLSRLNFQLDGLRTALADRFDAIPAPDLMPLAAEIATLAERVGNLAPPDLGPLEKRLARLDQQVAALPNAAALTLALSPPIEALRASDRTDEVLTSVAEAAATLRQSVADLPDPAAAAEGAITPLRSDVEGVVAATADIRRDLALVTEVLAGLTQVAEAGDARLTDLTEAQHGALAEHRTSMSQTVGELARTLGGEVQQMESQLVQLVTRTAALDDVQQGLARTREAVAALATRADRTDEASKQTGDDHTLALARVTAAADGLATTLGAMRASLATAVEASRDATIDAVDERIGARLDDSMTRVEELFATKLQTALAELGITQLRRSVAEATAEVVEGRTDARTVIETIATLDATIARASTAAVAPVATAVDRVRRQVEAIPAPDLGPVAAQLARLSATIVSQPRDGAATPDDLAALRTSLEQTLGAITDQIDRQTEATSALAAQVAGQPDQAGLAEGLRGELASAHAAMQASLDGIAAEVTTAREAAQRRPASRWRRGADDERAAPAPQPAEPSELEQRMDQALRDIDDRLGSLAQLVERAGGLADDAANASIATLRAVSSPPPPPPAPPPSGADVEPAATKAPPAKAVPAKKAPGKKAPAKKAAARTTKGTAAAKAASTPKAATKKATPAKAPAKKATAAKRPAKRPPPA